MRAATIRKIDNNREATPESTRHFVAALENAMHTSTPYDYWLLSDVLPHELIEGVLALPFAPMANPVFEGRRENNNTMRCHFSPARQAAYAVCRDIVEAFGHPAAIAAIERITGADLSQGQLRVEYCQDVDGFWLEPHLDLGAKLFTMMLYLSPDPGLRDAGTDIYDATPDHNLVVSAPYEQNHGMIFIPGHNTWHGFTKRPIKGLRKALMINFVSPAWRNKDELAYR